MPSLARTSHNHSTPCSSTRRLRDYSLRPRTNDFTLPVLGMGYIATYAASQGFNVGVIDAEALGLGVDQAIGIINEAVATVGGLQPAGTDV